MEEITLGRKETRCKALLGYGSPSTQSVCQQRVLSSTAVPSVNTEGLERAKRQQGLLRTPGHLKIPKGCSHWMPPGLCIQRTLATLRFTKLFLPNILFLFFKPYKNSPSSVQTAFLPSAPGHNTVPAICLYTRWPLPPTVPYIWRQNPGGRLALSQGL